MPFVALAVPKTRLTLTRLTFCRPGSLHCHSTGLSARSTFITSCVVSWRWKALQSSGTTTTAAAATRASGKITAATTSTITKAKATSTSSHARQLRRSRADSPERAAAKGLHLPGSPDAPARCHACRIQALRLQRGEHTSIQLDPALLRA